MPGCIAIFNSIPCPNINQGFDQTVSSGKYQHFIIGGTIKAATSSLYSYISAHPQVCGSRVKETRFFSMRYCGDRERDREQYRSFFAPASGHRVLFEASPEYLAYKDNVAPRIKQLIPDAKLLFVLRNPVDRMYSHYNFARGKMHLPREMSFEQFIDCCERYKNNQIEATDAGIAEQYLRALEIGDYFPYLENFYREFEAEDIKLIFFEEFNSNPLQKLVEIAEFIGVSPSFYDGFTMYRTNVTFSARVKFLHQLVLRFNRWLEPFSRRHPMLKYRLVKLYKSINRDKRGFAPMRTETRTRLADYYAPGNAKLKRFLKGQVMPSWIA